MFLERVFWQTIAALSEGEWQDWMRDQLKHKPEDVGRATYFTLIRILFFGVKVIPTPLAVGLEV